MSDAEKAGDSALERLAQRMGIDPEFRDAHGTLVRTSDQAKRSLLTAMGIEAADEAQARSALEAMIRADWLRPLPPVKVLRSDADVASVDITLPAGTAGIAWHLSLEDGAGRSARVQFGRLELLETGSVGGQALQRRRLPLPRDLPWGYHRLEFEPGDATTTLVVTPGRCWLPPALAEGHRLWGIAAQLYLLRSGNNWGIGDFGDLRRLVDLAAARGADVIGLNPLHAMFPSHPEHASPYSPASRLLLNILYIDVGSLPGLLIFPQARDLIATAAFQAEIDVCRSRSHVDYARVTTLKLAALQALFDAWRGSADPGRWRDFEAFRREQGEVLERNCRYFALQEHFAGHDPVRLDWHDWPDAYRDPASPAVARFVQENAARVQFLAWLQWLADEQLRVAASTAAERGMVVGLYRDLAVGADRAGAETWANPAAVVSAAQVGAPPDIHNPAGQDWGLPPFHPNALREEAYRSFVELLRANMRHAGGLRIDHVMGLQRLYWIPRGQPPTAGAYVRYPMDDLVGILALESHRQRCLVVGEDLGTVPEGFRECMEQANVLSYRVLFFERDEETGAFLPPAAYPELAMAVTGSHDLPTLHGWWEGRDIDLKERLSLYPDPQEAARQRRTREEDRRLLLQALRRERLLPDGDSPQDPPAMPDLAHAAHVYLARSPAALALVQIDDLTGEADQVNVPATSREHPNWRRRLSMTLEELASCPGFHELTGEFRAIRRR